MVHIRRWLPVIIVLPALLAVVFSCRSLPKGVHTDAAPKTQAFPRDSFDDKIEDNVEKMMEQGRKIFRMDSFGSEAFWGDKLKLHTAILGSKQGGVGPGLTPKAALKAGLKVDMASVPKILVESIKEGASSLENPETTVALLRADSVVGVKGVFDKKDRLVSIGITCALCHSTVDDSFMKGIGRRLDGWPNRDLNVGEIAAMAPDVKPFEDLLQVDAATVRQVLKSWGPGKYDAELNQDGKAKGPNGRSGATLIPAAFGLAGQNVHTYAGWGSIPYWNAYVANTQMYGKGTFVDPRLNDAEKYPVAQRSGFYNKRDPDDQVTAKLAALHFYQLAIPAPNPPKGSYKEDRAKRGEEIFNGKAKCATCHVPPLFSEPGWPMHTAEEMGIDDFQSGRSPDKMYRTTPLKGLFARAKGGFYHDGRFADYEAVLKHYEALLKFQLSPEERRDLIEYLKSL